MRSIIAGLVISLIIVCSVWADELTAKKVTLSGMVVNDSNKPVEGAKVMLVISEGGIQELKKPVIEEQTTGAKGSFSFSSQPPADRKYRYATVIAKKNGLAVAWDNWTLKEDRITTLVMGKPYSISGTVVDEESKPVENAQVNISMFTGEPQGGMNNFRYLASIEGLDLLLAKTDSNGIFVFNNIPLEAKAEFTASKAGKATIGTFLQSSFGYNPGQYTVRSSNIKIVLPVEARIEGKVIEKGTGNPVGGVKLMCMTEAGSSYGKPVISKNDGTFSFDGLEAKKYNVLGTDVITQKEPAKYVFRQVSVKTTAGKTNSGIIVEASKGGMLEVTIRDTEKRPIAEADIYVSVKNDNLRGRSGKSNSEGLAAIRLLPGEYQVRAGYKQGYLPSVQETNVMIEEEKTVRLEMEVKSAPTISGVVRGPDGRPIWEAKFKMSSRSDTEQESSDINGRYEIKWAPYQWGDQNRRQDFMICRHVGKNLAAVALMDEDTRVLDINLTPAITLSGKVVDVNGNGIENANVDVTLMKADWGMRVDTEAKTDKQGQFEYKCLPDGEKYYLTARAQGYGQTNTEFSTENSIEGRLEIKPLKLEIANMSVSGVVVDTSDKPVANAELNISGQAQQNQQMRTDAKGRFKFNNVCAGDLYINAYTRDRSGDHAQGYANATAGDTDIKIMIAERGKAVMQNVLNQSSGTLKIIVKDSKQKPVADARIDILAPGGDRSLTAVSDVNGIILCKLLPGEYEIVRIMKEGYWAGTGKQSAVVEANKTAELEIQLEHAPKITGTVHDANGMPAAKAAISILPSGQRTIAADNQGRFEISWNPNEWGNGNVSQSLLVARDIRRNLAAAADVNENTDVIDVNLEPGVTILGKVVDVNGAAISGAKVNMNIDVANRGGLLDRNVLTDAQGGFEFRVLPANRDYRFYADAEGYGAASASVNSRDAVEGRFEIATFILKVANMNVSGTVIDANNSPVASVTVVANGRGQRHSQTTTDKNGKFELKGLSEGSVGLHAIKMNGNIQLYGHSDANAGDAGIVINISPRK